MRSFDLRMEIAQFIPENLCFVTGEWSYVCFCEGYGHWFPDPMVEIEELDIPVLAVFFLLHCLWCKAKIPLKPIDTLTTVTRRLCMTCQLTFNHGRCPPYYFS